MKREDPHPWAVIDPATIQRAKQGEPGALRACASELRSAPNKSKALNEIAAPLFNDRGISKFRSYEDDADNAEACARKIEEWAKEEEVRRRKAANSSQGGQGTPSGGEDTPS